MKEVSIQKTLIIDLILWVPQYYIVTKFIGS